MYKDKKKANISAALQAKNVNIVNTPTVKIEHEKSKPYKETPTIRLTSEDIPELKDWKVGGKYSLSIEVEQTSMRQGSEYEIEDSDESAKDKKISATFKIKSVKSV